MNIRDVNGRRRPEERRRKLKGDDGAEDRLGIVELDVLARAQTGAKITDELM